MLGCISVAHLDRELLNENVALHLQLNPVLGEGGRDQGRRGDQGEEKEMIKAG